MKLSPKIIIAGLILFVAGLFIGDMIHPNQIFHRPESAYGPKLSQEELSLKTQTSQSNTLMAYRVLPTGSAPLAPIKDCENPPEGSPTHWRSLPLVVTPGDYCIDGKQFSLEHTGGYRFFRPPTVSRYLIVNDEHEKNRSVSLLSAIAWSVSHGYADDNRPIDDGTAESAVEKAKFTKLSMTCAYVTAYAQHLLSQMGYETRQVQGMAKSEWNSYNNNHVLFELKKKSTGQWMLADLDNNVLFQDQHDHWLNAIQVFEHFRNHTENQIQIVPVAFDSSLDTWNFIEPDTGYDYSFFGESYLGDVDSLKNLYRRVFQIILMSDGVSVYYANLSPEEIKQVQPYLGEYLPLSTADFVKKFYPDGK